MSPTVFCIMVSFNNQHTISASVKSILTQDFKNFELIIVDDASKDGTRARLKALDSEDITIIYNEKRSGKHKIINTWLHASACKYVCFADPDVIYEPDRFSKQVSYMERHQKSGALGGAVLLKNEYGSLLNSTGSINKRFNPKILLLTYNPFIFSTLIFRKSLLSKYDLSIDTDLKEFSFYGFMDKISKLLPIAILNDIVGVKHINILAGEKTIPKKSDHLSDFRKKQIRQLLARAAKEEWNNYFKLIDHAALTEAELESACELVNKLIDANKKCKIYPQNALYMFFKDLIQNEVVRQYRAKETITRSQLINALIQKFSYNTYLEIGVLNPLQNFDLIECENKTGIDPEPLRYDILGMSSDDFFNNLPSEIKYDLIFIDGLHHTAQVTRDIANALIHLNNNGSIVCHDMLPEDEEMQIVPRRSARWMGDCWKSWAYYRMTNENLNMRVIDSDCGLGLIRRGRQDLFPEETSLNYAFFEKNKKELMDIISVAEFLLLFEKDDF